MATNFFLLSSTYIGASVSLSVYELLFTYAALTNTRLRNAALEEVIADKTGAKDLKTGAAAGGLTGGFYAGIVGASAS